MNLDKIVSKLTGRVKAKQKTALEEYAGLVRQLADNKEPSVEKIETSLDAAGKTVADLQSAVERLLRRRQLKVTVDRARDVAGERAKIDQAEAAAKTKLAEAEATFEATVEPLYARAAELANLERQATAAAGELATGFDDETVLAEIARLDAEARQVRERYQGLTQKRKVAALAVEHAATKAVNKSLGGDAWRPVQKDDDERAQIGHDATANERRILATFDSEIAAADKTLAEIAQRQEEERSKMVAV